MITITAQKLQASYRTQIDEDTLKQLVIDKLSEMYNVQLTTADVRIEVKSKQNYKAEWEIAVFRATVMRAGS